jgi:PAS domain S-box-containing protein
MYSANKKIMYLNLLENQPKQTSDMIKSDHFIKNQSIQDLYDHKSLLSRAESIGRMGYWEYDLKSDKLWASKGARLIYGFDECELSLDDVKSISLPEYRLKLDQMFENLINSGQKYDSEFKILRHNDGEVIDIRSLAEYDLIEKKIFGIIQDISQQKKVEKELILAKEKAEESDLLKSAFVSNMSHEIRTPMNGIVGYAHLITEIDLDQETRNDYKEIIHLCCDRLIGTINDILDMAKIESGQVIVKNSWVDINNLFNEINDSCSNMALKKNLDLRHNSSEQEAGLKILTDEEKLNSILINLVNNAIRFTRNGYVEYGYKTEVGHLEFYVKDTGIGISASQHEIIFQPFCQAESNISNEYGGIGLGLTLTKKYVTLLGGKIWLESTPGEGTIFHFTIPKICETKKMNEKLSLRKSADQQKTCLIADDLEMNYKYLHALVTKMGFNVLWAKDGNEAIEMALSNSDIDLVLMDIRMPLIDGYEATRVIKEKRPGLPIIAQSANALSDDRKKALESGCDDYITKPINNDKFNILINSYFDS